MAPSKKSTVDKCFLIKCLIMVEAAGVERELGVIVNLLMARDFWG